MGAGVGILGWGVWCPSRRTLSDVDVWLALPLDGGLFALVVFAVAYLVWGRRPPRW